MRHNRLTLNERVILMGMGSKKATHCNDCGKRFTKKNPRYGRMAKCVPCGRKRNKELLHDSRERQNLLAGQYRSGTGSNGIRKAKSQPSNRLWLLHRETEILKMRKLADVAYENLSEEDYN